MYTERQKETYNFLEWCPLKSTSSKWITFGLVLATVLLITHVKKQRNRKCQKWDKCLQITTSPISKITETAPFPPHRLGYFNSYSFKFNSGIRKPIVNMITYYWIWMNSYWNVRSLCGGKGAVSVILEKGLVVIWRHLSHFRQFRFLCFLTWVMRRTVVNINPKIIHFDPVDFSGHHSKKL